MKERLKVAFVGVSGRGSGLMNLVLDTMPDIEVAAVCDLYADRTAAARRRVFEKKPAPRVKKPLPYGKVGVGNDGGAPPPADILYKE